MNKFIAHTLFLSISIFLSTQVFSQKRFGNEWIEHSQTYLRIPVVADGLYKVTGAELTSAGFSTDTSESGAFQMFWRGKEVAIQIVVDDQHNSEILFYGKKNDGALDSALYINAAAIPHTHYSLYSDTAAYFLTSNNAGIIGKRTQFNVLEISDSSGYHFKESEKLFVSHYAPGNFYPAESGFNDGSALTAYDVGEGWTGPEIKHEEPYSFSLNIENVDKKHFSKAEIELVIVGRSAGNHVYSLCSGHRLGLKRLLKTVYFKDFEHVTLMTPLDSSDFDSEQEVAFTLISDRNEGSISLSYARLRYPQKFMSDVPFGPLEPKNILQPRIVKFKNIDPQNFDYLIITHPEVRKPVGNIDPVLAYATYRSSRQGGDYKPLIVHSEDIYDQFNYGEPGPSGIRNIITWLSEAKRLRFVFLIGRSVDPQTARKSADARTLDMIPNAGWPGSDIALVMGSDSASGLNPIVPIGRLNAASSQHVYDYLIKVKAVEAEPASAAWRKNILHLSGGRTLDEIPVFRDYVKAFEQTISHAALPMLFETFSNKTSEQVEQFPLHNPINKGVALITVFGHSSLDVTDIDIGLPSDPVARIENHPRYPAIIINGCAAGSIFYSSKTLSTDWILSPHKGAVLFLAHTFNGLSTDLKHYTESFYEVLADPDFTNEPFGIIQNEAIRRNLVKHKSITAIITAQQMVLHGDPAIRIFPAVLADSSSLVSKSPLLTINVFPNPSTDKFRFEFEFDTLKAHEKVNIVVQDIWGRKVKKATFDAHTGRNEWIWNPENLPSGLYLYKLEIEQSNRTFQGSVQKALQGKLIWVH